jgi:hypothetical protein
MGDGFEGHPRVEKLEFSLEVTDNFPEIIPNFYD